ncbi:MAG: TfoX/Sxy family protein [Deltaproteobacteria bacterium]|nr:TfoX/Sxy family protein [Deltaproteobacteria bacterium]MBI3388213.1 TfoX/Sxy family protein [Deltaproteobacteria bacterium]
MKKKWKPAPKAAADAFASVITNLTGAEPRKMFGYACIFANGYLCVGLHEAGMIMRLADDDRIQFVERFQAQGFEPMPGRVMREYVVVPPPLLSDPKVLRNWAKKSVAYVCSLTPKATRGASKTSAKRPRAGVTATPGRRRRADTRR